MSADSFLADDDDDDDDSDEEFLTHHHHNSNDPSNKASSSSQRHRPQNREALVRQKLLENFYGKSAVAAARKSQQLPLPPSASSQLDDSDSDDDDDDIDDKGQGRNGDSSRTRSNKGRASLDWNSPNFDAVSYTRQHVYESSMQSLLETEEHLALQVRTLDSTMQTLVYENYSRFIDATDAIRSVGINVSAHEAGLNDLVRDMPAIEERARLMEDELGNVRDQVAEKIRVKRLLSRLDGLLKLPQTLRQQIVDGKYQAAARQYASAGAILRKHSDGFESLRTIESECHAIRHQLRKDLRRKLWHWSGRAVHAETDNDSDALYPTSPSGAADDGAAAAAATTVPAPRSLAEIFECAGALGLLSNRNSEDDDDDEQDGFEGDGDDQDEAPADAEDLQAMSLAAAMRLLDRLLDAHLIQVQERRFAGPLGGESSNEFQMHGSAHFHSSASSTMSLLKIPSLHSDSSAAEGGRSLVPVEVLHGIAEVAQIFLRQFGGATTAAATTNPALLEFVSEAFNTFLLHVRATLLEEEESLGEDATGIGGSAATPTGAPDEAREESAGGTGGVGLAPDVSPALHVLVSAVRDLSDRLVAAHIPGLTTDFVQRFVDQVVTLNESMVRRRVDQTFFKLRQAVLQTCLIPLVERTVALRSESTDPSSLLPTLVQLGGSTLSDCLQLVDDTIRSVFAASADGTAHPTPPPSDSPLLKEAVQVSANRFAGWLASALEILAGGESSDPAFLLEAPLGDSDDKVDDSTALEGTDIHAHLSTSMAVEDLGELSADNNDMLDRIDQAYKALHAAADDEEDFKADSVNGELILALAEMCRLAQGAVSESLEQSIASHVGSKKKQRGLFPSDESKSAALDCNTEIARTFQMAGSRLVVLFATNRGTSIAQALCRDLASRLGQDTLIAPPAPSSQAYDALELVKQTCLECAALYGGPERAGPVPTMEDNTANLSFLSTPVLARKTGLQLDVERMFKEKVIIYPHPQERLEASRCVVVSLALKVAFRALLEHVRLSVVTVDGLRQLHIDTEFLKLLVPHYIPKDYTLQGSNVYSSLSALLADVLTSATERCVDAEDIDSDDIEQEAREAVRAFMLDVEGTEVADKFMIQSDN